MNNLTHVSFTYLRRQFFLRVGEFKNFIGRITTPKSETEDSRRQEFIFNIIALGSIVLLIIANAISIIESIALENYRGMSPYATLAILGWFVFLFYLSRRGKFRLASYLLLSAFFLLATYAASTWGVEIQVALLFYVLIIVMSGILIGSRFAFIGTAVATGVLFLVNYLHRNSFIEPNTYWKTESAGIADITMFGIIFAVIAIVTWLSNNEIEKSLIRARKSEADLKDERDSLEIKVEERTHELKEAQAEKMTQLYRFAEFGRISSGLFHDLINPLNAVSLNLSKVEDTGNTADNVSIQETKQYVSNAVHAAKKLEDLVAAVRKQLAREETRTIFVIDDEIQHVIDVLSHKARKANVELRFIPCESTTEGNIKIFGDAIKFNQVVLNLVANGIDACLEVISKTPSSRWVQVSLAEEPKAIVMVVEDNGIGILDHHMDKIFEPFFTTKANGQGIGIGLSMAKRIVEKDFGGLITAKSEGGKGALFKATFPLGKEYATK